MQPTKSEYYKLLGVPPNTTCIEQIKAAFRRHILQTHPDKQHKKSPVEREVHAERTQLLIEAYKVLTSPELKRIYDESLRSQGKEGARHFELLKVDPNLGSSEIEVEFDCEQCEGENKVKVQMQQARDFVIVCQYCGLRTRLLMQADL